MSYGVRNVVWKPGNMFCEDTDKREAVLCVWNPRLDSQSILAILCIKSGLFSENSSRDLSLLMGESESSWGVSNRSYFIFHSFDTNDSKLRRHTLIINNIWISPWKPFARLSGRITRGNVFIEKRRALRLLRLQKAAKRWQKLTKAQRRPHRMWQTCSGLQEWRILLFLALSRSILRPGFVLSALWNLLDEL